jgi:hypothetical protein
LDFLSEDTIKRATLSFMKTYYKFRPRTGETVITFDMTHPSGVIVDGHLTFSKENGAAFVATFEATSAGKNGEVKFTIQNQQLFWDSLAIAIMSATVAMYALWFFDIWTVQSIGWLFSLLGIVGLVFILTTAYRWFFKQHNRYRYIYAIEQFKQYHADEQWIAIGHDVFSDYNDPHYIELRNQCVSNGFGLVIVDPEEHVDLRITPAREEVFGKKRRTLKFMETPSVEGIKNDLQRYKRPYFKQLAACTVSSIVLMALFYTQQKMNPTVSVGSESTYQDSMENYGRGLTPEPTDKVVNPEDIQPISSETAPYTPPPPTNDGMKTLVNEPKPEPGLYVYTPTDGYLMYECSRIRVRGTMYVVQDVLFKTFDEARERIEELKRYGLIANCISLSCTESAASSGYCVYYELMYDNEGLANTKANQIKTELETLHLPHDFIKIRTLRF